jgi:hypothetical protein
MKICTDCPNWSKEFDTCDIPPSRMDDVGCLLKFACWCLAKMVNDSVDVEEEDGADFWKKNT